MTRLAGCCLRKFLNNQLRSTMAQEHTGARNTLTPNTTQYQQSRMQEASLLLSAMTLFIVPLRSAMTHRTLLALPLHRASHSATTRQARCRALTSAASTVSLTASTIFIVLSLSPAGYLVRLTTRIRPTRPAMNIMRQAS